jgi:Arc/MetJ-type ribon-helix-helix transcriptional regulator
MNAQLTVRLPQELDQALTDAALQMRRKRSEVVRFALESYLQGPSRPSERSMESGRQRIGSLDSGSSFGEAPAAIFPRSVAAGRSGLRDLGERADDYLDGFGQNE